MRKMKGICWLLILAIAVTLIGCASGGGEVTEPTGTGGTTAPTKAVMQNSGGGSKATEPDETEAPTVENAGGTSEPDSPSESNSTEATTGKSAEPTAGSTSTGSTSNTGSGNTSSTSPSTPAATQPKPTEPAPTSPPAHTHSYTETVVAPSCTSDGYTLHKCGCGDSYKDNVTAALGHSFGSWVTTKEATVSEEGQQSRTCSRCGATETQAIAKLPAATLDLDEAMWVGNEYAASKYGWIVDYSLNADNAGYDFPSSLWLEYYQEQGQERLNQEVKDCVDSLYNSFIYAYGNADGARINCHVYYTYWDGQTFIDIAVYYG